MQGEVVEQQFGEQEVAFRTLDLYTSAVLEASLNPAPKPEPEWRDVMAKMSEVSFSTCTQGLTATASPCGVHALSQKSGRPWFGRPGKSAPVLCIAFTLLSWVATRHTLGLNMGSPACF